MRVVSSTRRSTAGRVECVPASSLHHLARACDETFDICTSLGAATTALTATTSIPKSVSDATPRPLHFLAVCICRAYVSGAGLFARRRIGLCE